MTGARVSTAQANLTTLVDRAVKSKKRTILSRRGKDVAAVVPIEDLRRLEHLARKEIDRIDLTQARDALAEREKKAALRNFLKLTCDRPAIPGLGEFDSSLTDTSARAEQILWRAAKQDK